MNELLSPTEVRKLSVIASLSSLKRNLYISFTKQKILVFIETFISSKIHVTLNLDTTSTETIKDVQLSKITWIYRIIQCNCVPIKTIRCIIPFKCVMTAHSLLQLNHFRSRKTLSCRDNLSFFILELSKQGNFYSVESTNNKFSFSVFRIFLFLWNRSSRKIHESSVK